MIVLVKANVLAVGLGDKSKSLRQLPIRVIDFSSSVEARGSFKNEEIDSIISHWDLPDGPDGNFLKLIRCIKPDLPIIALVEPGNTGQEISARSIGANVVISSDVSDEYFRCVVAEVLGLGDVEEIEQICAAADEVKEC